MDFSEADKVFRQENGILFWKERGRGRRLGPIGTDDGRGYLKIIYKGKGYFVHRIVFLLCNGELPDVIDHINGDPKDNRAENLRACTVAENMRNRHNRNKNNTSGFNGVYWSKVASKWMAYIMKDRKRYHLGYFDDIKDAAKARSVAEAEYFGEFAP